MIFEIIDLDPPRHLQEELEALSFPVAETGHVEKSVKPTDRHIGKKKSGWWRLIKG